MQLLPFLGRLAEGQNHDIANLQANTVLTVFHGTDYRYAESFCKQGIDGRQVVGRLYPHWDQGKVVTRGLFVTTKLKTAISFGRVILRFKVLGKDLWYMYPSPQSQKAEDNYSRQHYPGSFRPSVSAGLLSKSHEPQALYRGLTSPRAIEMVYLTDRTPDGQYVAGRVGEYQSKMTREEFLAVQKEVHKKERAQSRFGMVNEPVKPLAEPQERLTLDQFLAKVHMKHKHMDPADIESLMLQMISGDSTLGQKIAAIQNMSGERSVPYTLAKRLVMDLLHRHKLPMGKNDLKYDINPRW